MCGLDKNKASRFSEDELVKWFKLTQVKGVGPQRIKKLLNFFGNINIIFDAKVSELLQARLFNEKMLKDFNKLKVASEENFFKVIKECKEKNIEIVTLADSDYPRKLVSIPSPPPTLFLLGKKDLLYAGEKIAIVGNRAPSQKAIDYTYNLSKQLSEKGITIVSGGALGIDTAAHKGALDLEAGKTISVLGSGFNHFYPPENVDLFDKIKTKGLLVSEHLPNFKGSRISYLQRNRITSGISDALFLVAAEKGGGSMTQTVKAHLQRKPIFCPKIDEDITPNEGVKEAIEKYNARQIENTQQLLKLITSSLQLFA